MMGQTGGNCIVVKRAVTKNEDSEPSETEEFPYGRCERRRKGTGIGLAITKAIMEAHGGSVLVRSQLNNGSTFILQFPEELLVEEEIG